MGVRHRCVDLSEVRRRSLCNCLHRDQAFSDRILESALCVRCGSVFAAYHNFTGVRCVPIAAPLRCAFQCPLSPEAARRSWSEKVSLASCRGPGPAPAHIDCVFFKPTKGKVVKGVKPEFSTFATFTAFISAQCKKTPADAPTVIPRQ